MYGRINPFTGQMELAGAGALYTIKSRPPNYADVAYAVPILWIDDSNDACWILLRISGGVGYWLLLGTIDPYPYGAESGATLITEAGDALILQ